jgi:hypothetical protein
VGAGVQGDPGDDWGIGNPRRSWTYAGIVHQDIEAVVSSSERLDRGFDGGQVGQIKVQKLDAAAALG